MVESKLIKDKLINFEPQNIDPDTLDNCPICGRGLTENELKTCIICIKCWNDLIQNYCED